MQELSVILKYVYTRYSVQPLGGHVYSVHTLYKQCIVERRFTHVSSWLRYNWAAVYVWCVRLIAKYLLPIRPNNTRSYLRIITWCRIGPTLFVCCSDRTHCNSRTRIGFMLSEIMSRHSRHTGCRIMLTIGENSGWIRVVRPFRSGTFSQRSQTALRARDYNMQMVPKYPSSGVSGADCQLLNTMLLWIYNILSLYTLRSQSVSGVIEVFIPHKTGAVYASGNWIDDIIN